MINEIDKIQKEHALSGPEKLEQMKGKIIQQISDLSNMRMKRVSEKYFGWEIANFPIMSEALDGLHEGLILIAADTNIGKTTLLTNIVIGVLQANVEAEVIFCSFDDSIRSIYNYFISRLAGVSMNNLWKYQRDGVEFEQVESAKRELQGYIDNDQLFFYEPRTLKDLEEVIRLKYIHATHEGRYTPDTKVMPSPFIVFIDGWDYISGLKARGELEKDVEIADSIKNLVTKYELPIICTSEIRKEQTQQYLKPGQVPKKRLLTTSDVSGSKRKIYRSNSVILLQPDNTQEFHDSSCTTADIIANYSKNKMGAVKGLSRLRFRKLCSKIDEIGLIGTGNYVFGQDNKVDSFYKTVIGGNHD
jgi:replicative DNA helicase